MLDAVNSGNPHPAVTSPAAVRAVCSEILERAAGRVLAGDQAGVESVRLTAEKGQVGSTRALMDGNGLLQAIVQAGAEPHFFDEQGYEDGYVEATLDFGEPHWPEPPRIARIVTEVDHMVMLTRLSSHAIAGCTLGHKCAVGWLRDDSRYLMHFTGGSIHQVYTEVNYCREIRNRLRLTLTLAEVERSRSVDLGNETLLVEMEGPPQFVGKTLKELELRRRFDMQVMLIKRREKDKGLTRIKREIPGRDFEIRRNDLMLLLGSAANMKKITSLQP